MNGLRAATQDAGIATFDGQRGGLDRHIGTALVNHAKDTDGHPHMAHADAAGAAAQIRDLADGVGHRGNLFAAFCDGGDDFVGESQPVHHGRRQTRRLGRFNVLRVGCL